MNDSSIDLANHGVTLYRIDDIRQSWTMILNTVKGSDPLRPEFGSGIFDYIDKPIDQFEGEFLAQAVRDLEQWEKRTTITQVSRSIIGSQVILVIKATYTETNTPINTSLPLFSMAVKKKILRHSYSEAYNQQQYL